MKLYLLLLTATFSISSFAQNFSVESTDTTFYGNATDSDFDSRFILSNDSSDTFPMSWSVESSNIEAGWEFSICDPSLCHPKGASSGFFDMPIITVNSIMNLHYYPNNNAGQSTVSVKLWENAYPNDFLILNWTGIVSPVGIETKVKTYLMSAYPNPAINNINIQFDLNTASDKNEIFLYDVSGRKIGSEVLTTGIGSIEFPQNLNSGIYFYSLISNGQAIMTKKVIKK
jgi:hypothetical protein|tara:strand:- start:1413 stop:2099 length:687 start_codon:yes stop_codon:yes gene_type:complete